jgi:hypothetical protein
MHSLILRLAALGFADRDVDGAAHARRLRVAGLRLLCLGTRNCGSAIFLANAL